MKAEIDKDNDLCITAETQKEVNFMYEWADRNQGDIWKDCAGTHGVLKFDCSVVND